MYNYNYEREIKGLKYNSSKDEVMLTKDYDDFNPIVNVTSIILNKDCFCNNVLQAWGDISLNKGSIVIGSIQCGRDLSILAGFGSLGQPTAVIGDIYSDNKIKVSSNGEEGFLIVHGNVFAAEVELEGSVFIRGNLYVEESLECKGNAFVAGRTKIGNPKKYTKSYIENFGTFGLYAFGELRIGPNCSVLEPIISINEAVGKKAKISFKRDVNTIRVISAPCFNCVKSEDILRCPKIKDCLDYSVLTKEDLFKPKEQKNSYYLSWYWRCLPETILHHYYIEKFYKIFLKRYNKDRIKFMLNNPTEFKDIYSNLLDEIIEGVESSVVDIKKWLKSNDVQSSQVLEYMNIKDVESIDEIFETPEAYVIGKGEKVEISTSDESPEKLEHETIELIDGIFSDDFNLNEEMKPFPYREDLRDFSHISTSNKFEEFSISMENKNAEELLTMSKNLLQTQLDNMENIPTKTILENAVKIIKIKNYARENYSKKFYQKKDSFNDLVERLNNLIQQFIIHRIQRWSRFYGIDFRKPVSKHDVKIESFINPWLKNLQAIIRYLKEFILRFKTLNLLEHDFKEAIETIIDNMKFALEKIPIWQKENEEILRLVNFKNVIANHYDKLETGKINMELVNILDRLSKLADKAGFVQKSQLLANKRDKLEEKIKKSGKEKREYKKMLQKCQVQIGKGQVSPEIINNLRIILQADQDLDILTSKERRMLKDLVTRVTEEFSEQNRERLKKLRKLGKVYDKISMDEMMKKMDFKSKSSLKEWLQKTIQQKDLDVRISKNSIKFIGTPLEEIKEFQFKEDLAMKDSKVDDLMRELDSSYEEWEESVENRTGKIS